MPIALLCGELMDWQAGEGLQAEVEPESASGEEGKGG